MGIPCNLSNTSRHFEAVKMLERESESVLHLCFAHLQLTFREAKVVNCSVGY